MRLGFWIITPPTLAGKGITPMQKPNRTLLGNHRLYRHINDAADENKLGRLDNEDTDNPVANATQTDVSDKLFRS